MTREVFFRASAREKKNGVFLVFFLVFLVFFGGACVLFGVFFVFRALAGGKLFFFGAGMSKTGNSRSGSNLTQNDGELRFSRPDHAVPLESARQRPENQKENQAAGHSPGRVVEAPIVARHSCD